MWAAIDAVGDPDGDLSRLLGELPLTPPSLERLLRAVDSADDQIHKYTLGRALQRMDLGMLRDNADAVLAVTEISDNMREFLRRRIDYSALPSEAAWDRLTTLADQYESNQGVDYNGNEVDALAEAAGRDIDTIVPRVLAVLADESRNESWHEVFAVQVLGCARYAPAIDQLVLRFDREGDFAPEEAMKALSRIGTDEVSRALQAFIPGKEWAVRLYADDPLSHIKRPSSEAALLALIPAETDDELLGHLLFGLAELGSLAGLDFARPYIERNPTGSESIALCEQILGVAGMSGVTLAEDKVWRRRCAQSEERFKANLARFDAGNLDASAERPARRMSKADKRPPEPQGPITVPAPIRRDGPKVGRNDPCPCGSGKKYKKCCGK